ncbi:hypothetical protein CMUS01_12143 [Colletotrichum musicola]|uniref:Uncharacterized protein n=1 Tax=Colletotrichum musicola TaxID=2175873 RepID=A0A8H6N1U0_9PEZI|nr:hypothetical protein CMUS01_12143 [Colletotrichum musicola]
MSLLFPWLPESDLRELNEDNGPVDTPSNAKSSTSSGEHNVEGIDAEETKSKQKELLESYLLLCGLRAFREKPYQYEAYYDNFWLRFDVDQSIAIAPHDTLSYFLNSLAEVCSFEPWSTHVTAVLAEQRDDGGLIFHVTRNAVAGNDQDGKNLVNFLEEILHTTGEIHMDDLLELSGPDKDCEIFDYILNSQLLKVIVEGNGKFRFYRRKLKESIRECNRDRNRRDPSLTNLFLGFDRFQREVFAQKKTDEDLVANERSLIIATCEFSSYLKEYVDKLRPKSWAKLYHYTGRLRAHISYVLFFLRARKTFPGLFHRFEVRFLDPRPSRLVVPKLHTTDELRALIRSGEGRGGNWDDREIQLLRRVVADIYDHERKKEKGVPCFVHAEVALIHWFWNEHAKKRGAAAFFRNFPYVGISKPCCPLCKEFIAEHPSRIQCRDPHPNFYPKWTLPALKSCERDDELRRLYRHMLDKIQSYSKGLLSSDSGVPGSRDHDSEDEFEDRRTIKPRQIAQQSPRRAPKLPRATASSDDCFVMPAERRGTSCAVQAEVWLAHWFWNTHMSRNATSGGGGDDEPEVQYQK